MRSQSRDFDFRHEGLLAFKQVYVPEVLNKACNGLSPSYLYRYSTAKYVAGGSTVSESISAEFFWERWR
ncbi:MAG: hypothetical protein KME50_21960 [Nostoc desertorum CM1-VF14]|jgi:hypothetical protein|nr:hypothetical protein [Nostoc desertorum CM1-VF14]